MWRCRWVSPLIKHHGVNLNQKKVCIFFSLSIFLVLRTLITFSTEDVSESEESEEEESEDESESTSGLPTDGLQTPSGLETPSGMASVVSTVAGGLETPDFLELRKTSQRSVSDAMDTSNDRHGAPRSLYQVVPERQTSIKGFMGSERGYDVAAVTGAPIPVLGDERGTKVFILFIYLIRFIFWGEFWC